MGAFLGFVYDIFRIFRREVPMSRLMTLLQDMLYWLVCTALMFCFFYVTNSGEIRGFVFFGAAAGGALYFFTVSRPFVRGTVFVIDLTKSFFVEVFRIVSWPVRLLLGLFRPRAEKSLKIQRNGGKITLLLEKKIIACRIKIRMESLSGG
jgi:spore cortex biosynthesis protein YabQ